MANADSTPSGDDVSPLTAILRRRRMTRHFDGGPPPAEVRALCATALRAPSAGFSQGTHLLIMVDEDLAGFWTASGAGVWFAERSPGVLGATAVVLVVGDRQAYLERYGEADKVDLGLHEARAWAVPYWLTDAAMVAENLLLLAEERGWGALFFGLHTDHEQYFGHLGLPSSAQCIGAVALGFRSAQDQGSGSPTRRGRHPSSDHLHLGRW